MGKPKILESISIDSNANYLDIVILREYKNIKIKPIKSISLANQSIWDLIYNNPTILPYIPIRCHPCLELIEVL